MINFNPITIHDRTLFQSYIDANDCLTCDWTFVNIYCWQYSYKMVWAEWNQWLIIRCRINGERRIGYMILPKSPQQPFDEIVSFLKKETTEQDHLLLLTNLKNVDFQRLQMQLPDCFVSDENRDWEDYVYEAQDLRELKGRKFAAKRNHIHRFEDQYAYRYETLRPELFADCIRLENEWRAKHSVPSDDILAEQTAIRLAFQNYDALNLVGGVLYVDNQIVAFTYGSELNEYTFCTHIEKADIDYDGVFAIINRLFAQHLPLKYKFINREEDMGLEGLRQSKLSYIPAKMEHKLVALYLNDDMRQILHIWNTCFGDEDEFIHSFLSRYCFKDCAFVHRAHDTIVAMSFLIPCETELGKTAYQYGVATLPEYRKQGIAAGLVKSTITECRQQGYKALFLIPADQHLKEYYGHLGYQDTDIAIHFIGSFDLGTGVDEQNRAMMILLDDTLAYRELPRELHCRAIM